MSTVIGKWQLHKSRSTGFRYWWNPETNARYYTRDDIPHGWGFFRKDGVERFINVANGEQSTEHPSESKRVVVSVGGGGVYKGKKSNKSKQKREKLKCTSKAKAYEYFMSS